MMQLFDTTHLISLYGELGIFVIVFLESGIFFPLPGDSLVFTAGLLAPELHFNIFFLLLIILIATFFGGLAGYFIGTKLVLLRRYSIFQKLFKQEYLDRAEEFFEKYGFSAIVLARFVPIVRTFMPIAAGVARMNYSNFAIFNLFSSVIWTSVFTLGGYFLGRIFPQIGEHYLIYAITAVVFLSFIPGIVHFLKKKKSQ